MDVNKPSRRWVMYTFAYALEAPANEPGASRFKEKNQTVPPPK